MEDDDASAAEPPSPRQNPAPAPDRAVLHAAAPFDIDILNPKGLLDPKAALRLQTEAQQVLAQLGVPGEIRARLVDDAHMTQAHEQYTNTPGTTDVLTFDLRESAEDPLDVDLLICVDEAIRQSLIRSHSVERELLLYVVHGVLHCLGYDDHTEADAQRIHAREDALLTAAGIGPIFAAKPTQSAKSRVDVPHTGGGVK